MPVAYVSEAHRLAAGYARGVQDLVAPTPGRAGSRAGAVAMRSDEMLVASRALTQASVARLAEAPHGSLGLAVVEVQLLAGATLDLTMAGRLFEVDAGDTRGLTAPAIDLALMRSILEAPETYLQGAVGSRAVRGAGDARRELSIASSDALREITHEVVSTGAHVIQGMLMVDAAVLGEATAILGGRLGKRIGADVVGLSRKALEYILLANDKIGALLGVDALARARVQVNLWLDNLRMGTLFPDLIRRIYGTEEIEDDIESWLSAYSGQEAALLAARDEVMQLAGRFDAKAAIVDKVSSALALLKIAPPLATPIGRVIFASSYLLLLVYLVGSGYDHVDSDRLHLVDWVDGVRGVSQRCLLIRG